jgi:hypothetical protein
MTPGVCRLVAVWGYLNDMPTTETRVFRQVSSKHLKVSSPKCGAGGARTHGQRMLRSICPATSQNQPLGAQYRL